VIPEKFKKYVFLVPAVFLFIYTASRAYLLSFTIDEATTYLNFCLGSYHDIFHPAWTDANNHVLNSVLMKFFSSLLPVSEFTLRLPSLLAHVVFLVFTWLLLKDIKNERLRMAMYLLINLNPFLLDFFSMARGYALSWACMAASLYCLKCFLENQNRKAINIGLGILLAALAVLANFAMLSFYIVLNVFCAFAAMYNALVYQKKTLRLNWIWVWLFSIVIIGWPLVNYTLETLAATQNPVALVPVEKGAFWGDFMTGMAKVSDYGVSYPDFYYTIIKGIFLAAIIGCFVFILSGISIKKRLSDAYVSLQVRIVSGARPGYVFFIALFFVFSLILVASVMKYYVQGAQFVFDRTTLFMIVAWLILLAYVLSVIKNTYVVRAVAFVILAFSLVRFAMALNISYSIDWKMNANVKQMMLDLGNQQAQPPYKDKDNILQTKWEYASACQFYKKILHYDRLKVLERDKDIDAPADFYYYTDSSADKFKNQDVEAVKKYPDSKTVLLKNEKTRTSTVVFHKSINMYDSISKNPSLLEASALTTMEGVKCVKLQKGKYAVNAIFNVKTCKCAQGVSVHAEAKVFFPAGHKIGDLSIAEYDNDGKVLEWHSLQFSKDPTPGSGWVTIPYEVDFNTINPNAAVIKAFVWNTGDADFYVADMVTEMKEL